MKKIEAIIFDLDGTLWDSREAIQKTWNRAIEENGRIREPIGFMELSGCLGLPMDAIAERLFADQTEEIKKKLMEDCCRLENEYLAEHGAVIFPNLEKTLAILKRKYRLFINSNCQSGYIEAFLKAHKLSDYFEDIICWGDTGRYKGQNNLLLMERNHVTKAIYVGDTQGDADAAKEAGLPFIFCKYGFGQVTDYVYVVDAFADLIPVLDGIATQTAADKV